MSMDAHALPDDVAALQALLLAERQERFRVVTEHQQFVAQHQRAVAQHETALAEYDHTIQAQRRTIEQQARQIAQLLRRQYGPKQERVDPDQLMLFTSDELQQVIAELSPPEEQPDSSPSRKRPGHGRRRLPADLPREQKIYELSAEERACPCCGEQRQEIGSETSEQLEVVPAQVKIIEHVRKKYACRRCQEQVAIAAKPPQPIDKGLPGPGLLAHAVLSKYGDHLPLYRQEDILARHGVVIRRSTLCGWMASAAELARPLWELMRQRVLQSQVIHTDDTLVKMLAPLQTQSCRFWAYVGDGAHPYSIYDFTTDRSRDGPAKFLKGFSGYLQADAYGGYDGIYAGGQVIEVACMAHCRRYWWEARTSDPRRAHAALSYIGRLYELEEAYREANLSRESLKSARQAQATPILDEMEGWLDEQRQRVLPKSVVGKAFSYTRNQWTALRRYVEDGALAIDNNVSERTVKIAAIGRKNWLFVGSRTGGERAAILFTLIASCKANQVEPFAYLRDVFASLAEPDHELENLLPDRWLAAHPEHRWQIDVLRHAERKRSRKQRIAKHRRQKKKK